MVLVLLVCKRCLEMKKSFGAAGGQAAVVRHNATLVPVGCLGSQPAALLWLLLLLESAGQQAWWPEALLVLLLRAQTTAGTSLLGWTAVSALLLARLQLSGVPA